MIAECRHSLELIEMLLSTRYDLKLHTNCLQCMSVSAVSDCRCEMISCAQSFVEVRQLSIVIAVHNRYRLKHSSPRHQIKVVDVDTVAFMHMTSHLIVFDNAIA